MDSNYKVQFECASQLIKALIQESNEKNKLISELEAKNRELRYNPYHDPSNGRFTSANSSEMLYVGKGQAGKGIYVFENEMNDKEYTKWIGEKIKADRANRLQNLVNKGREAAKENDKAEFENEKLLIKKTPDKNKHSDPNPKKVDDDFKTKVIKYHKSRISELEKIKEDYTKKYKSGGMDEAEYKIKDKITSSQYNFSMEVLQRYASDKREIYESTIKNGIVIAVDFDNTIALTSYPQIISPIYDTILFLYEAKVNGAIIVLWTCREGEELRQAVEWCNNNFIPIDFVNENVPDRIKRFGSDCRKISADIYIDDKAVCAEDLSAWNGLNKSH